jgi:hypothetical protein
MSEPRRSSVGAFFGALLMAVGGLIAALSGMCTAYFVLGSLFDGGNSGNVFAGADVLLLALVVGGIPIGIGVLMFLGGRALYRSSLPLPGDPP